MDQEYEYDPRRDTKNAKSHEVARSFVVWLGAASCDFVDRIPFSAAC